MMVLTSQAIIMMNNKLVAKALAEALLTSQKKIIKSPDGIQIAGHGQSIFIPFNSSSANSTTGRSL